jgi:hypothetical protein
MGREENTVNRSEKDVNIQTMNVICQSGEQESVAAAG